MSIDVSVIVPVYNAEKYLRECLDSLLRQTLKNVEFIFVDDGSTDRSPEILEEYRQRDDRIKVLRQQNQYAGVARNNGMKLAKGKYLSFLDADDLFKPTMLEEAFRCAEENRAEIVIFAYRRFNSETGERGRKHPREHSVPAGVFTIHEVGKDFFIESFGAAWNKLFLRSFVESRGLEFQPVKKCNDAFFVETAMLLAERIKHLNRELLQYRVGNPDSISGNMGKEKVAILNTMTSIKKKAKELNLYRGAARAALVAQMIEEVHYNFLDPASVEDFNCLYEYVKPRLVPELFDEAEDFREDTVISRLHRSRNGEEFLFLSWKETKWSLENEYIPMDSHLYRIGHAITGIPYWIAKHL